jgi:LmbE family N-acetylglucosaminyl deacetylase
MNIPAGPQAGGAAHPMSVLAVGAHPDDIELGCGATLARHVARGDTVALLVMTSGERGPDAHSRIAEQEDAASILGAALHWGGLRDGAIVEDRDGVGAVERVLSETNPDVVYTHASADTHQDHRATAACTLAATRRLCTVMQYNSPTSTDFSPRLFVDAEGFVETKLNLIRAHLSQVLKNGLVDLEAVEAEARYRGFQGRLHHAEGFEVARFVWDLAIPTYDGETSARQDEVAHGGARP